MFPEEVDLSDLPEQKMYKIDVEDTHTFDSGDFDAKYPVFTNELRVAILEGEKGDTIDWHTHLPTLDQVAIVESGRMEVTLEQEDGEQVEEIAAGELAYIPAGARHKLEVVGDDPFKSWMLYPNTKISRLEALSGEWGGYGYDGFPPVGLWVDKLRDDVVAKDDNAVSD